MEPESLLVWSSSTKYKPRHSSLLFQKLWLAIESAQVCLLSTEILGGWNMKWLFYDPLSLSTVCYPRTQLRRCASSALQLYFGRVEPSCQDIQCCFLHCSEENNFQKYFRLYNDGLHTHNECCTIAVLFFVFGEVILSIKAAIAPSLYAAIDNRASSAVKFCPEVFIFVCSGHFLVQVMILSLSGTKKHKWLFFLFGKLYLCSKQTETSFSLSRRLVFVFGFVLTATKSLKTRLKGKYCFPIAAV